MIIHADRIFPVASPPRAGAVLVRGGRIARIAPLAELRAASPGEPERSFPGCVILPGLVNAHVHLEYSGLGQLARPSDFFPWIRSLVKASRRRRFLGRWYWARAARRGVDRLFAAGVTCAGEIVTFGGSLRAAAARGLRTRAFLEAVAVGREGAARMARRLEQALDGPGRWSAGVAPGISPHAVYTLSPEALRAAGELAGRRGLPLAVHAGETRAEPQLLRGEGPLAGQIPRWGLPFGPGFRGGLAAYLDGAGLLGPRTLVVHGVHLGAEDLDLLAARRCTLVTCPRSNEMLRAGRADWAGWARRGVPFVYGTDSLASVPDFDLFEEARRVREAHPEDGAAILRRLTLGGAAALGLDGAAGSLEEGKAADLAVLRLERAAEATEEDVVGRGSAAAVAATVANGRLVFERGG